jgi:hypothetical protein
MGTDININMVMDMDMDAQIYNIVLDSHEENAYGGVYFAQRGGRLGKRPVRFSFTGMQHTALY